MNHEIIEFYENKRRVGRHKLLFDEVIRLDDEGLEKCHDYIQWLFPLPEPSKFMPNAPLLDEETAKVLASEYSVRIMEAVRHMMRFWHVTLNLHSSEHKPHLKPSQYWMTPNDHNHLRLTRIMRFLTLMASATKRSHEERLLYSNVAKSILFALVSANDETEFATKETVKFWEEAAKKGWEA